MVQKGLFGSWDGQSQGNSETYGGEQHLEAEHDTNLHYFHQKSYISARKYNGVAKPQALYIITLMLEIILRGG